MHFASYFSHTPVKKNLAIKMIFTSTFMFIVLCCAKFSYGVDLKVVENFYSTVEKIVNSSSASIELTPDVFAKSVLNLGDIEMFSTFMNAIAKKQCTKIVTIGGSICGGMETAHRKESAFPKILVRYLNDFYPCNDNPNGHEDFNECINANGSPTFIDLIMQSRNSLTKESLENNNKSNSNEDYSPFTKHLLFSADLVLVDTSVNDVDFHDGMYTSYFREIACFSNEPAFFATRRSRAGEIE